MGKVVELDDEVYDAIAQRRRKHETVGAVIRRLTGNDPIDPQWVMRELTARVLEGIAAGNSTGALTTKIFMSRQGIEYHVSLMLKQFKVPNRVALVARATALGVLVVGCWPPRVRPEYIESRRPVTGILSGRV